MSHLREYLEYYTSLKAPGYAVLVTGAWGTGKTFQIKECISEEDSIYVSLYGLQTVGQVHAEVFAQAHPTKAKAASSIDKLKGKVVSAFGFSIPLGFVPDVANAFLRNEVTPDKTLIFDDMERSAIDRKELLGAINSYVEHKDFRVIVIAHDDEKLLGEDFRSIKEKTFGQTVRVEPQVSRALDRFMNELEDGDGKEFVEFHKLQIENTFRQSQEQSFRLLRQTIEDLVRLHNTLLEKHLNNSNAMVELIKVFTAFAIEFRSGNLQEKDLRNRRMTLMSYLIKDQRGSQTQLEKPPLVLANQKYSEVDLDTDFLNDDVLVSMLVEGSFPKDEIRRSIDNSSYFIVPGEAPPWKVVINFDELDDKTVEDAAKCMEEQFKNREVTEPGEMLHIFSLRMMMAENGIIDKTVETVVKESKAYIDDLLKDARLPPSSTDMARYDEFNRSYDGLAFWVSEANGEHFKDISDHLAQARETALQTTFPEIAANLLGLVSKDSREFFEAVSTTNNGPNPYASIPILHEIPPEDFVSMWLSAPEENWRYVRYALENRFDGNQLERELSLEKDWIFKVLKELDRQSASETGFRALRIKRIRPKVSVQLEHDSEFAVAEAVAD